MDNSIERFFPQVNHGINVRGGSVLVQGMHIPKQKGLIELLDDTRRSESYNIAIGRVVALGPLAFKNKETLTDWKEGKWADVGDIVYVPRTGYRIERTINEDLYSFVLLNDTDILATLDSLDGLKLFQI